jgi:hypothetical protein
MGTQHPHTGIVAGAKLPPELVVQLQDLGFGGKRISVPARRRDQEELAGVTILLGAMADRYEAHGETFMTSSGKPGKRGGLKVPEVMSLLQCGHRLAKRLRLEAKKKWDPWSYKIEGPLVSRLLEDLREVPDSTVLILYRKARVAVRQEIDPLTVLTEPPEMADLELRHARVIAGYARESVESFPRMKPISREPVIAVAAAATELLVDQGFGHPTLPPPTGTDPLA